MRQHPLIGRYITMKVTITGKNIEVSEYLRDLALKKIAKLERYFPEDTEVLITMAVEKNRHIVEVTIPYQGGIIRGEESTGDMYASIDNVIAKLEKQIHRHKTRLEKSLRYDDASPEYDDYDDEDEDEDESDEDGEEGFDFGDEDSTIYEVQCACGNIIDFDEEVLESGSIVCDKCGETLEFSFDDEEDDGDEE